MPFIMHTLAIAGINGFFFLLIFSILLAWAFPEWGMEGSRVPFDEVTYYGVAAIFFFYGVKLSPESLKLGLDRKSTRLNSSHVKISYAVFCLKKKTITSSTTKKITTTINHDSTSTITTSSSYIHTNHLIPIMIRRSMPVLTSRHTQKSDNAPH